jgi:hypothetical protein
MPQNSQSEARKNFDAAMDKINGIVARLITEQVKLMQSEGVSDAEIAESICQQAHILTVDQARFLLAFTTNEVPKTERLRQFFAAAVGTYASKVGDDETHH